MVKIIGVTGGVGAGKSSILQVLKQDYRAYIIIADEVGHRLMKAGGATYKEIIEKFKDCVDNLVQSNGEIDKSKLAEYIFGKAEARNKLNAIVHPLVHKAILREIEEIKTEGKYNLIIVEAAILKEGGLDKICDEIWYVYAPEETRINRLMNNRDYSRDKAIGIIKSQVTDSSYRELADRILDNGGSLENSKLQIKEILQQ